MAIPDVSLEPAEVICDASLFESSTERALIATFFQSGVNPARWRCVENDPRLRLSKVRRRLLRRHGVIWMNLHRKISLAIEEFKEQRKPGLRGVSAEQFSAARSH